MPRIMEEEKVSQQDLSRSVELKMDGIVLKT